MAEIIDRAFVEIIPLFRDFDKRLRKGIDKAMTGVVKDIDTRLREVDTSFDKTFVRLGNKVERNGRIIGRRMGTTIGRSAVDTFRRGNFLTFMFTPQPGLRRFIISPIARSLSVPFLTISAIVAGVFGVGFVGSLVAIGFPGLVGALFLGIAGFALRENKRVVKAFEQMGKDVNAVLTKAAQPLARPFAAAFNQIGAAAKRLGPTLRRIFSELASAVKPATDTLIAFVEGFFSAFEPGDFRAIGEIFKAVAGEARALGVTVGEMFDEFLDNKDLIISTIPRAFAIIRSVVSVLDNIVLGLASTFNTIGEAFDRVSGKASELSPRVKTLANDLRTSLQPAFASIGEEAINTFDALKTALTAGAGGGILGTLQRFGSQIGQIFTSTAQKLGAILGPAIRDITLIITNQLLPAFREFLPAVAPVVDFLLNVIGFALVNAFKLLSAVAGGALKGLLNIIKGTLNIITGILQFFTGLLTGNWSKAWRGIKNIAEGALQAVVGLVQIIWNIGLVSLVKRIGVLILKGAWTLLWNGIKLVARGALSFLLTLVRFSLNIVLGIFRGIGSGILALWRGLWNTVRGLAGGGINAARSVISSGLSAIRSAVGSGVNAVINFFRALPGRIKSGLGNLGGLLVNAGRALIDGFIAGIKAAGQRAIDAAKAIVKKVRDIFPGSPAKEGPLAGRGDIQLAGEAFSKRFAEGILANLSAVIKAATRVAREVSGATGGLSDAGRRVQALTTARPAVAGGAATVALAPNFDVRVFLGDREIKDVMRIEISERERSIRRQATAGTTR